MKITYIIAKTSRKNFLPPELLFLTQICTKSFVGWGFAPDSTGEAYSAAPDPLVVLGSLLLRDGKERGGEGMAEEGTWVRGREETGDGGRGGPEMEGGAHMTLWHRLPMS